MTIFDGTNPILDAVGDEDTERLVTFESNYHLPITEPFTGTKIPAGDTVELTVIGDIAFEQITKNIAQINTLKKFNAITVTGEVQEPGPGPVA